MGHASDAAGIPDDFRIGIQARIEDAGVLADNGRLEGALLLLLVAVAATSRKRYPAKPRKNKPKPSKPGQPLTDREAFTKFLKDEPERWHLTKGQDTFVSFRGSAHPIEEFLYEYLPCNLVHEGDCRWICTPPGPKTF